MMLWWWLGKHWSFHSLTIFWSYALGAVSIAMELMLMYPDVSNSLNLGQFIPPAWLPFYTFGIAALTMAARLRSILWREEVHEEKHDVADPR